MLAGGVWGDRQLLSHEWIEAALTPSQLNAGYGLMWWLDTRNVASTSRTPFSARGAGGNVVQMLPEHELVVVTRWAGDVAGVIDRVVRALA